MGQPPDRVTDTVNIKKNRRLGEKFVIAFNKLLHAVRIHGETNEICVGVCGQFKKAVQALMEENGELTIKSKHSRLFIQGDKLLHRPEMSAVTFSLLEFFEKTGIYGFSINDRLISAGVKNIYDLACTLNTALSSSDSIELVDRCLKTGHYPWISVLFENQQRGQDNVDGKKEKSLRIYSNAYNSLKDVGKQISEKKHLSTRKAMRSLQNLLSIIYEDQNIVLGLSTIRDFDDYTYTHSVNVSILSMCLGKTIGLSRSSLMLLGMCSMFHDLGKIDLDVDILNKPGKLTDDEFRHIQKHSLNSVRQIIRLDALRDLISKLILPPFEHHLKYDLSGYPQVSWKRPISLFGRIIAICDVYDALTTPRVYRPVAMSPDRALGIMVENSGKDFDPILQKWFINMIGVYPVGTLVKLDTGEIGLTKQCDAKIDLKRPPVLLLKGDRKGGFVAAKEIKLQSRKSKSGGYVRNIVSTHHASELGIQPSLYLS